MPADFHLFGEKTTTFSTYLSCLYWDYWPHVPIAISIIYLVVIFSLQRYMKTRERFELRYAFAAWNLALGAFSIMGFLKMLPIVYTHARTHGINAELCSLDVELRYTPWVFLFCVSKIPELLDTVFIVLRKGTLRVLQWYHHFMTMHYCWWAWAVMVENGGTFAFLNLFVHSLMYPYFGLSTLRVRMPAFVRPLITSLQIAQMVGGMAAIVHNFFVCASSSVMTNLYFGFAMYVSYFLLFVKLFMESYVKKPEKKSKRQ